MSPAKTGTIKTKGTRQLTIDFSGICTLVVDRKGGVATVQMVDLASAGFQRHFAALGIVVSEETAKGVKGPDADAAVSLPGEDRDIGLWDLMGTEVEVLGATGALTVDTTKVDTRKRPVKGNAGSLEWLPNISVLTESSTLDPICPTAASIAFTSGIVTALAAGEPRKMEFVDDGTPVVPARYYLPRFRVTVPFATELALRLDRQRVLRFRQSMSIIMSNTCVCGLGLSSPANHFYAHYDVVAAKRKPTLQPVASATMYPEFPEWCYAGVVIR